MIAFSVRLKSAAIGAWLLLCSAVFQPLKAEPNKDQIALQIMNILAQYRAGSLEDAARAWQHLSQDVSLSTRVVQTEERMLAGVSMVLASLAWRQAEDKRAYSTWQAALEMLLELGLLWEELVAAKISQIDAMNRDLGLVAVEDQAIASPPVQLDAEALLWVELEKSLKISKYRGPANANPDSPNETGEPEVLTRQSGPVPLLSDQAFDDEVDDTVGVASRGFLKVEAPTEASENAEEDLEPQSEEEQPEQNQDYTLPSDTFLEAMAQELDDEEALTEVPEELGPLEESLELQASIEVSDIEESDLKLSTAPSAVSSSDLPGKSNPDAVNMQTWLDQHGAGLDFQIPPGPGNRAPLPSWRPAGFTVSEKDAPALRQAGQIAWSYMERNYQPETGFINAVEAYPFATMWDIGSGLAATVCAFELDLLDQTTYEEKITRFIATLESLPLYDGVLPNREYTTNSAEMTDFGNKVSSQGSGWSALDLGRFLCWLAILKKQAPQFANRLDAIVTSWNLAKAVKNGQLYGGFFDGTEELIRQEGRLGYEQYAAGGFALWGMPVMIAQNLIFDGWLDVEGLVLPIDQRNLNYLTSEPFFLARMELASLTPEFVQLAAMIYEAQQRKAEKTGELVAVSEDAIARFPWFVYNCIAFGEQTWVCVDRKGQPRPSLKSFSSKAGWAWGALFDDSYAQSLLTKAQTLHDPKKGFFSGEFGGGVVNASLNVNTNAVILEALYYLKRGAINFQESIGSP